MSERGLFDTIVGSFRQRLSLLPDKRTSKNTRDGMEDAALSVFSVFFTQTPSFLAYQRMMEGSKGNSNAQSLFGVHQMMAPNTSVRARPRLSPLKVTVLGDDLYCRQPLCQELLDQQFNFLVVCHPESHTTLYEHLEGGVLPTVTTKRWTGKVEETYTYRYLNGVPLRDSDDALLVNWCEVIVSRPDGKVTYKNSFAINHLLSDENVAEMVLAGRARWKVESGNNNTLKTKGYNLEHNFGHGKQHLSSGLATLNITGCHNPQNSKRYYIELEEQAFLMKTQTAFERYEDLVQRYPDILARVKLGHLASYLGITQETLSRIRARHRNQQRGRHLAQEI